MSALPLISHRLFAAAARPVPGPETKEPGGAWAWHEVTYSKVIVNLELVGSAEPRPKRPARRLRVWNGGKRI